MRLRRDENVFLMGEDVGRYGGCYAVSKGLLAEFGPQRIRDTPLSEFGFTGAGIGAAMAGMRPIVELMTVNFSLLALDQILNTAATRPPHVGKSVRRAAGDPHGDRRGPSGRRPAFAQPRRLVCAYPGHQGAGAGDAGGCARHAVDRSAGPRPGADFRKRHALQHERQARRGRRPGRYRQGRRSPRRARYFAHHLWRLAVEDARGRHGARRREHRRRGRSICAACGRSTTRPS